MHCRIHTCTEGVKFDDSGYWYQGYQVSGIVVKGLTSVTWCTVNKRILYGKGLSNPEDAVVFLGSLLLLSPVGEYSGWETFACDARWDEY